MRMWCDDGDDGDNEDDGDNNVDGNNDGEWWGQ